jgi:hypothetical protein
MDCIIEFAEPFFRFKFHCNRFKQKFIVESLLHYGNLTPIDIAALLGIPTRILEEVHIGKRFLQGKSALQLMYLFFIFFSE